METKETEQKKRAPVVYGPGYYKQEKVVFPDNDDAWIILQEATSGNDRVRRNFASTLRYEDQGRRVETDVPMGDLKMLTIQLIAREAHIPVEAAWARQKGVKVVKEGDAVYATVLTDLLYEVLPVSVTDYLYDKALEINPQWSRAEGEEGENEGGPLPV